MDIDAAIIDAAKTGNVDTLMRLLKGGGGADVCDRGGRTALSWAAGQGHTSAVELLLQNGWTANVSDKEGRTPLSRAAENGDPMTLQRLLDVKGIKLDLADAAHGYRTPLFYAVDHKREDAAKLLVKKGAGLFGPAGSDMTIMFYVGLQGNVAMARALLDKVVEMAPGSGGPISPCRAIWAVLRASLERGKRELSKEIVENESYTSITDGNGRTLLSWIAGMWKGTGAEVEDLVARDQNVDLADHEGRTPLSWAAGSGNVDLLKLLLGTGASLLSGEPDTPLVWAARRGRTNAVKFLARKYDPSQYQVPLFWAAVNGHVGSFGALLDHGAYMSTTSCGKIRDRIRAKLEREPSGQDAEDTDDFKDRLRDILSLIDGRHSGQGLLTSLRRESEEADRTFKATVTTIPEDEAGEIISRSIWVADLLEQGAKDPIEEGSFRWLHLPANNMEWVEVAMAKHFSHQTNLRYNVLYNKIWGNLQHKAPEMRYHGRFMTPTCHRISLPVKSPESTPSQVRAAFVLFMPYLHWESKAELNKLKETMKTMRQQAEGAEDGAMGQPHPWNDGQKLLRHYLHRPHPLHPRRTLDQYRYHFLDNTDSRDNSQVVEKYGKQFPGYGPSVTMVDQLWMWVLPQTGESPPAVITAFPQRSDRLRGDRKNEKVSTLLVSNILAASRAAPVRTAYDLAGVISSECAKIYLDTSDARRPCLHFIEIFKVAIQTIIHEEMSLFDDFAVEVKRVLDGGRTVNPAIPKSILLMRDIKDIMEELGIILSVSDTQKEVLAQMRTFVGRSSVRGDDDGTEGPSASGRKRTFLPIDAVDRNIRDVKGLLKLAEDTADAVGRLLDLQHKQARLVELKSSGDLMKEMCELNRMIAEVNTKTGNQTDELVKIGTATQSQAREAGKQGKTLMTFTIVTVIFLPVSFMAAFFAIDITEFPRDGDSLSLAYVLEVMIPVSATIIALVMLLAYSGELKDKMWRKSDSTKPSEPETNPPKTGQPKTGQPEPGELGGGLRMRSLVDPERGLLN